MSREKEGFRDNMALLNERFPERRCSRLPTLPSSWA